MRKEQSVTVPSIPDTEKKSLAGIEVFRPTSAGTGGGASTTGQPSGSGGGSSSGSGGSSQSGGQD